MASTDLVLSDGRQVRILPGTAEVKAAIAAEVAAAARSAIAEKGAFSLCVPGGFGPADGGAESGHTWVGEALSALASGGGEPALDFSKFHVFFCGERLDGQHSYECAHSLWIKPCGVPSGQVHAVAGGMPAEGAAATYTARICMQEEEVISDSPGGLPAVDLMLLDVGDDGTVGRIRPGSPEASEMGSEKVVLPVETPGAEAVAVSLDFINASRRVILAAPGGAEQRVATVAAALGGVAGASPAALVRAQSTLWVLDADSAANIEQPTSTVDLLD